MGCFGSRAVVDKFLFAAPEVASYNEWSYKDELVWVPLAPFENWKSLVSVQPDDNYAFPCRLVQCPSARYLVIYFHKNGDDLGKCKYFVDKFSAGLGVHVLVVEYPGYGLCWDRAKNATELNRHAMAAIGFAQLVMRWPLDSIILYGACIGVGPAMVVAAEVEVAGLILVGAFLSVKKMVRCHSRLAAQFVAEVYPNEDRAPLIRSPTLIFHGEADKLVPVAHAEELHKRFKCNTKLVSLGDLGHHANLLQDENHLMNPIKEFFQLPGSTDRSLRLPPWASQRLEALRAAADVDAIGSSPPGAEATGGTGNADEEDRNDKRSL